MARSCAACLSPIDQGDKFVLSGTEVFHRRCAGNIDRSIGQRQKQEIIRLRAEVARERADAAKFKIDAQEEKNTAERFIDRLHQSEGAHSSTARQLEAERVQNRALSAARSQAQRELDTARAEIQRLQIAALERATSAIPEPVKPKDTRDDTEIRFSLLELDGT